MKRKITPFTALVEGNKCTINCIMLTNFSGYDFSVNGAGSVEYALGYNDIEDNFTSMQSASINIPKEVVAGWGGDDNVIADFIIKEKKY
jgi:hypothetical protein